ncbi:hypothetical protein [Devosia sp. CAU 1758]
MIALVAASLALPLQVLGHAATCTMGDSDSAVAGSFLSSPLLVLCFVMLLRALLLNPRCARPLSTGLVLMVTVALTFGIWFDTIFFQTPCGPDYADYAQSTDVIWFILIAYLMLPAINIALCLLLFLRTRHLQ